MKITTKINVLTTVWMLCMMILFNVVVFFLFMKTTINMEEDIQVQNTKKILNELKTAQSSDVEKDIKRYLTANSYIRIVQPKNKVIYETSNDALLTKKIKPKYRKAKHSETHLIFAETGEEQVLVTHVPIHSGNLSGGSLEIGERLIGLESKIELLRGILITCTLLAAILSLLGGRWLANLIMRPITNMIKTMEDIERSGVPKTITTKNKTKDELQIMAGTFNRMIQKLQVNMEKQKQFISDASHELKTPLTVIKSYANLLRRRGFENEAIADEAVSAIHSEATRIQKMTETFLYIAHLENENELEIGEVNLVTLCQSLIKQLKDVYKREIHLHVHRSPIMIEADELKIKQVLIILLDNAMKYSNEKINVHLNMENDKAFIKIKDKGIGIPEDELEQIFERFYRVDKARSRETGGSGLGLHIAKNIIQLHKGEILVTSKLGEGTEVVLTLNKTMNKG